MYCGFKTELLLYLPLKLIREDMRFFYCRIRINIYMERDFCPTVTIEKVKMMGLNIISGNLVTDFNKTQE